MIGALPADRFGRRPTLLWIGVLYFVSAVWSGLATGVYMLSLARFIGGVGVDNAAEVRDLILDRLRSFRETGLGDPDEVRHAVPEPQHSSPPDVLLAARELLVESRALGIVLSGRN